MRYSSSDLRPSNPIPQPLYWLLAVLHVVCPLLFFTDLTRNPYFTQISLLHGGLCLALILFVVNALGKQKTTVDFTPLDLPLLVFLGIALLSLALSWTDHAALRMSIWNEGTRVTHFLVVNGLVVYWLAAQMRDPDWNRRFKKVIYVVGAIAGGYGILQYMGVEFVWSTTLNPYSGRPVSTFGNPNFLSSYLVLLLPLVVSDGLKARTSRPAFVSAMLFFLFGSTIVCTMTRSSWIGAIAALAVFCWFARSWVMARRRWVALLFAAFALLVVFWPSSPLAEKPMRPVDRVSELVRGIAKEKAYGSWHQRLLIWSCAWDMVKERPLLGKGWGCFELFYPFYQGGYLSNEVYRQFRTHANNAHNIILEIWSQVGTVGLGVFLLICFLFFELARRRIPALPENERLEAWALLAGLTGMWIDNFFGNVSVFFAVPAFLFWWMAGTLGRKLSSTVAQPITCRGPMAWFVGAGIVILSSAGIVRAYCHWRAEVLYFDGFKKAKSGDIKGAIADTEKSHSYRRWEVNNNYELANAYARQSRWAADRQLTQEAERTLERALWAYDEAIAANGGYDEIYFNRGTVLAQMNRSDDAVVSYQTALVINPLSLEAHKALGNVYLTKAEYLPKAEGHFKRAVEYFPRDKDLWNNLGYVYSRLGKNNEAVDAYAQAVRLDFRFPMGWKNFHSALVTASRKQHPLLEIPDIWRRMEESMQSGNWSAAESSAEKLLNMAPENEEVRVVFAGIALRQGEMQKARENYEKALSWSPQNVDARRGIARIHLQQGNRSAALDILRALVQENPEDRESKELLQRAERPEQ